MSDTPRLNALLFPGLDLADAHDIVDLARQLERENDELREALKALWPVAGVTATRWPNDECFTEPVTKALALLAKLTEKS